MKAPAAASAQAPWRDETGAMLALAWPLVLANVTQQVIIATDILLMGRLGPVQLAAGTLALNLTYTLNMFLLGLVTASAPMMATALGRKSNAVRDVRRTFRAGLWILIVTLPIYWLLLWHVGAFMRAFGQPGELAQQGQSFLRAYMWCTAPWLVFTLLRNFVSSLERPHIVFVLSLSGIAVNALLSWSLIFGHFGLPRLGLVGGGLGSTLTWAILCGALIVVASFDRQFRRFALFGRWWRLDSDRVVAMVRLGLPIGITMALEMGVFALAAYFMGWIGAPAVAAHAVALQLAALTFMVPLGLGQAATVRVGLAFGLSDVPANAGVIALAVSFLRVAAAFQLADGAQVIGAGMLRGLHDTRWPLLFALFGYWVVGLGIGTWLAFGRDWKGTGIWVGLASGLAAVAVLMLARWMLRGRLGLIPTAHV
jgi:multidrug resistance protein, MATE family